MIHKCLIIIVTYNSEKHIQWAVDGLSHSKNNLTIRIVDSGSKNTDYLDRLISVHNVEIIKEENIGFVAGNNKALYDAEKYDWVLFLNPDARIDFDKFDLLLDVCSDRNMAHAGIFSVPLVRFDIDKKLPLEVMDSMGIACSSIGRWYDIKSNDALVSPKDTISSVDAVCGAFMMIRVKALQQCLDKSGQIGFERSYHMYKEDIELSLRFKKKGWDIKLVNSLNAYHCRGWNSARNSVPYWARLNSAVNDLDIASRYKLRALPYAIAKYIWVRFFEKKQ